MMKKKILITISCVLAVSVLCFIVIFAISVNQAKNIVRLINKQNYEGLEDACETAFLSIKYQRSHLLPMLFAKLMYGLPCKRLV